MLVPKRNEQQRQQALHLPFLLELDVLLKLLQAQLLKLPQVRVLLGFVEE